MASIAELVTHMPDLHAFAVNAIPTIWLIWVVVWIVCAFGNKRTVHRQAAYYYLRFVLLGIILPLLVQLVPHPFSRFFPPSTATDVIGLLLCAAGLGWSIWARITLGSNWSGLVTLKQSHELIQDGPYRITRHPIYTGLITAFIGTFLAVMPTGVGAIYLVGITAAFTIKLRMEEKVLLEHFPEAYAAYKTKVKAALFPWVW